MTGIIPPAGDNDILQAYIENAKYLLPKWEEAGKVMPEFNSTAFQTVEKKYMADDQDALQKLSSYKQTNITFFLVSKEITDPDNELLHVMLSATKYRRGLVNDALQSKDGRALFQKADEEFRARLEQKFRMP